jgi:hypothetical protein
MAKPRKTTSGKKTARRAATKAPSAAPKKTPRKAAKKTTVVALNDRNSDHATPILKALPVEPAVFRVRGPMSTFGGPHDFGMSPSEGLALFEPNDLDDPRHRDLFLAAQPPGTTGLGRRLNPDKFYLACRWDYKVTSRSFLRNTTAEVISVKDNTLSVAARPCDWGPHADTGRIADLSPGLAAALRLNTDDEVVVIIRGAANEFITAVAARTFAHAGAAEPKIISAEEWGAAPAHASHFAERPAAGIVVHNTESANREATTGDAEFQLAAALARSIQNSHFARGFADTGQHFTVSRGGLLLEGRHGAALAARAGRVVEGAHAVSDGGVANKTWFGIEIEGDNRASDQVTEPQYAAVVELCAWLMKWTGVPELPIKPHLQVLAGHTDCPGKFADRVAQLRADVAKRRQSLG